jgi:hypothetical protein
VSTGSRHIPFEQLIDFVEGRLSPAEQAQSRAHVSACHRCAAQVAWLEYVIELMRTDDIEEPPPRVATHITHSFRSRSAPAPLPLRQRIIAALRFDSAQLPLPLGMRSGPVAERQLIFSAEGLDLDLRITPAGSLWMVSGQALVSGQRGQVELRGPSGTVQAELSEMSEFVLPPVPPGDYTLILRLADVEVEATGLKIDE